MELKLLAEYENREEKMLAQLEERESLPPRDQLMNLPKEFLSSSLWDGFSQINEDIYDELIEELSESLDDRYNEASHLDPLEFRTFLHAVLKQLSVFDSLVEQSYSSLDSKEKKQRLEELFEEVMGSRLKERVEKISRIDEFAEVDYSDFYQKNQFELFVNHGKSQDKAIARGDANLSEIENMLNKNPARLEDKSEHRREGAKQ